MDLFSRRGMVALGARAHGLTVFDDWSELRAFGCQPWDFSVRSDQVDCLRMIEYLDPVIVHCAVPHGKQAVQLASFSVEVVKAQDSAGSGGSIEILERFKRIWSSECVRGYFGIRAKPNKGRFFARLELFAGQSSEKGSRLRDNKVVVAGTYQEIESLRQVCKSVAKSDAVEDGRVLAMSQGFHWGQIVAGVVACMAKDKDSAYQWADRELRRQDKAQKEGEQFALGLNRYRRHDFATFQWGSGKAISDAGEVISMIGDTAPDSRSSGTFAIPGKDRVCSVAAGYLDSGSSATVATAPPAPSFKTKVRKGHWKSTFNFVLALTKHNIIISSNGNISTSLTNEIFPLDLHNEASPETKGPSRVIPESF